MKKLLKRRMLRALLPCFLVVGMLAQSMVVFGQNETDIAGNSEKNSALYHFLNPDYTEKPMARLWFPDATAGMDENDVIEKQIKELSEAGFGGVEVTFMKSSYTNEQAQYCGFGTESWRNLLKKVYAAANKIEGGFKVDLGITGSWPANTNNIDPNDPEASQELSTSFTKITEQALSNGNIQLELPETKLADRYNKETVGQPFIFTDTLVDSVLVQVNSVNGKKLVLDYKTMKPISAQKTGEGQKAGVPDEATCLEKGWDYDTILSIFGPEPDMSTVEPGEKLDAEGNRVRMADWQPYYNVDLSQVNLAVDSNEETIKAGDWIILSTFTRGTGLSYSPTTTILQNRPYAVNHIDESGINSVIEFWNENILCDAELAEMIRNNGSSIAEDSIELKTMTNLWSYDMIEELTAYFGENYKYKDVFAAVIGAQRLGAGFYAADGEDLYNFTNVPTEGGVNVEKGIIADYAKLKGKLFEEQHLIPAREWAESIGADFRAQTYTMHGVNVASASSVVSIPEGDNQTKGDGIRQLAAVRNLYGKDYVSMEALTGKTQYQFNWEAVLYELTANFSGGLNRAIFHGTPYSKAFNNSADNWPGWEQFGGTYGESYSYRQIYWDDANMMTGYISRIQALFQNSIQKVDLLCIQDGDEKKFAKSPNGNSLQSVLNNGYSYDVSSDALIEEGNARVISNKMIYEDGPGYRAVILDNINTISCDALQTLIYYAKAGIPIIAVNCSDAPTVYGTPTDANGTENDNNKNSNTLSKSRYQRLCRDYADCVVKITDKSQIPAVLKEHGIYPRANYNLNKLETSHYQDRNDGTDYYFLYNNNSDFDKMITATKGKEYKNNKGNDIQNATVTLTGSGTPYFLDPMTGTVTQAGQYKVNDDGTISVVVDLIKAGNAVIIALSDNYELFPAPGKYVVSNEGNDAYSIVRESEEKLVLRSTTPGQYSVNMNDGTVTEVQVPDHNYAMVDLASGEWDLTIKSYGPEYKNASTMIGDNLIQTVDPSDTKVIPVEFGKVTLKDWNDLAATSDMLSSMEVSSMSEVSGKGVYSRSFEWDGSKANLWVSYGNDQITGMNINGHEIQVINNMTDTVELGDYLIEGTNTLSIEISTTLYNRACIENPSSSRPASDLAHGLLQVELRPYASINITEESPVVNKTNLQDLYNQMQEIDQTQYVNGQAKDNFNTALENANTVLDDENALQPEIDKATDELQFAFEALEKLADKEQLEKLLNECNTYEESKYTPVTWEKYAPVVVRALGVYENENAGETEVKNMVDILREAMLQLRAKADKTLLETVLQEAKSLKEEKYTQESYAVLLTSVQKAENIMEDENVSQEDVDISVTELNTAINELEEKSEDNKTEEAEPEGTEEEIESEGTEEEIESEGTEEETAVVETGDESRVLPWALMLAGTVAAMVATLACKRKKR